ncbi:MAG: DNA-binding response regulator [Acidobacteria bacterium]|nr:MAG: DNA-binding response regulator [Acidobacteriota bacterium]
MIQVLLVEDEPDLRFSLKHNLTFEGYEVDVAEDGEEGSQKFEENNYDLIILDIMMPKKTGLELLEEIRKTNTSVPVLMLTAKSEEMDKVIGLEMGADDYLGKPFGLSELLARVKALIRRSKVEKPKPLIYSFLDFKLDLENYQLTKNGEDIHFSQKEFQLLKYLIRHANQTQKKTDILEAVWHYDSNVTTRTIDTHIARIRRKMMDQEKNEIIQTVPTVGYRFVAKLKKT